MKNARSEKEQIGRSEPELQRAIARALLTCWPRDMRLTAYALGLESTLEQHHAFLGAIRALCDDGLVACEAIHVGPRGPEIAGAMMTARGRAVFLEQRRHAA